MKILISILFLTMIISFLTAIRTTDICLIKTECNEDFPFKCNRYFCGKDNQTCEYLNHFEKSLKFFQSSLIPINFENILNNVFSCIHKSEYKWKPADICLKQNNCFNLKYNLFFVKIFESIDPNHCKCEEKYNVQCQDRNYCGLKKSACDNIIENDTQIKKCGKTNYLNRILVFYFNLLLFIESVFLS